jgi:hypothetical protein
MERMITFSRGIFQLGFTLSSNQFQCQIRYILQYVYLIDFASCIVLPQRGIETSTGGQERKLKETKPYIQSIA